LARSACAHAETELDVEAVPAGRQAARAGVSAARCGWLRGRCTLLSSCRGPRGAPSAARAARCPAVAETRLSRSSERMTVVCAAISATWVRSRLGCASLRAGSLHISMGDILPVMGGSATALRGAAGARRGGARRRGAVPPRRGAGCCPRRAGAASAAGDSRPRMVEERAEGCLGRHPRGRYPERGGALAPLFNKSRLPSPCTPQLRSPSQPRGAA